jgi:AcrR family transcriptional regulator
VPTSPASVGARARARAELTSEIKAEARRQLADVGASGLSLRAVARELGMVSSAVYRYFPSRDDLLTALIIDAYDAVGEAVEAAEATCRRDDVGGRWMAVCRTVRRWALDHPYEYGLVYGSPVPGYAAPQDTVGPGTRVTTVLSDILADAQLLGVLDPPEAGPLPRRVKAELAALRRSFAPTVPESALERGIMAWTLLFGFVSFELFGQYHSMVDDTEALFDHAMASTARLFGLWP